MQVFHGLPVLNMRNRFSPIKLFTVASAVILITAAVCFYLKNKQPDYVHGGTEHNTSAVKTGAPARVGDTQEYFYFRNKRYANDHFKKHRAEFNYSSVDEYVAGANRVIDNPDSLYRIEQDDGDFIYFLEKTGEIVFVSRVTDRNKKHFIRTYFRPDSGIRYFNRQ